MYLLPETEFDRLEQLHQALGALAELVTGPNGTRPASLTPEQMKGLLTLIEAPLGAVISQARWEPSYSATR